jgi:hypothetical protein
MGRGMSVHLDRSRQLAISPVGISQASNDVDRPRQHLCARLSAQSKPGQQQPKFLIHFNSKNAGLPFNSIASKKLPLFPASMVLLAKYGDRRKLYL